VEESLIALDCSATFLGDGKLQNQTPKSKVVVCAERLNGGGLEVTSITGLMCYQACLACGPASFPLNVAVAFIVLLLFTSAQLVALVLH